jgi:hypothetical protein
MKETEQIDKFHQLRKVMGTLPSESPQEKTEFKSLEDSIEVTLEDYSTNPYRALFSSSTATWGDNNYIQKWPLTSIEGKLEVIKACLMHKTLPQCKEAAMFTFRVKGTPRWLFDYHAQNVNFCFFMSSGVRDNSRQDCDIVKNEFDKNDKDIFLKLKELYTFTLGSDKGSWQSSRSFLPLSFAHHYFFGQNMLSIVSTKGFHASGKFKDTDEDQGLLIIYKKAVKQIGTKFPLLALYLSMMWENKDEVMNKILNLTVNDLSEQDIKLFNQNEI